MSSEKEEQMYFVIDVKGNKITEFSGDHLIVHKNSIDAYNEKLQKEEERELDQRGEYVQFFIEPNRELEDITIQQRRYLIELMPYVQYEDVPLSYESEEELPVRLNNHLISKVWNLKPTETKSLLSLFVDKGFLKRVKDPIDKRKSNYIPTGLYFGKGKLSFKPSKYTTKVFQNKLVEIIERVNKIEAHKGRRKNTDRKQSAALGIIHAVLPYFHYQTYYLVKNPNDNILRDKETVNDALERIKKTRRNGLKHLKKTELAKISGIDVKTVDRYIDILVKAGAVMRMYTKGTTRYIVHPDLMFRRDGNGEDEYTRTIRNQFEQH